MDKCELIQTVKTKMDQFRVPPPQWLLDRSSGLKKIYMSSQPEKGACKLVIVVT